MFSPFSPRESTLNYFMGLIICEENFSESYQIKRKRRIWRAITLAAGRCVASDRSEAEYREA